MPFSNKVRNIKAAKPGVFCIPVPITLILPRLVSLTHLHATIQSAVSQATTKIYSRTRPAKVLVNGEPATNWGFDQTMLTATIPTLGIASVEVWLK